MEATALDGQITRHATTGSNGRYTILFPDGGGQYRVTVRYLGMAAHALLTPEQWAKVPERIRAPRGGRRGPGRGGP